MHEEKKAKNKKEDAMPEGAVPPYLLDREGVSRAKVSLKTGSFGVLGPTPELL
jgi:hypothetical protein